MFILARLTTLLFISLAGMVETFAADEAMRSIAHDSLYRGLPADGKNGNESDIGVDRLTKGFRVGDIVYAIDECSSDTAFCLRTPYLTFFFPNDGCKIKTAWEAYGDAYKCNGEALNFSYFNENIGSVYTVTQTSILGRLRVFYYSVTKGVILMNLSGSIYVLQSPIGIGGPSSAGR